MSLRARRRLIGLACHLALGLLCVAGMALSVPGEDQGAFALWGAVWLGYLLTLRLNPIPRWLQTRALRQTLCPACSQAIDLMDFWGCGCGFVAWHPRHAFSPCPNCGKAFRWIVCPSCQAHILI
jgi:hypothetical protein